MSGESPGPSSARYALDGLSDSSFSSSDMEWEDVGGEQWRRSPRGRVSQRVRRGTRGEQVRVRGVRGTGRCRSRGRARGRGGSHMQEPVLDTDDLERGL